MEMEKRQRVYKVVMLVVLTVFITFMCTSLAIYKLGYINTSGTKYVLVPSSDGTLGTDLSRVRATIDKYFLGAVDEQKVRDSAIKGYVEGLEDEYTEYMTSDEMNDFKEQALGTFDGIGIYLSKNIDTGAIFVIAPIKNSPAYKAGILPGDIITKVDDFSCIGQETTEVSKRIKGTAGTSVKLEILRDAETLTFDIVREHIQLHFVEGKVLENKIGYIEVASFDEQTSKQFEEKYNELKAQGITSLIVDLRNNPGGLVEEALSIANFFIPKGELLLTTIDKDEKRKEYKADKDSIVDIPTVLLVNENSASASEILAGCLKDYEKAKIVGKKTYGKGVIQELLQMTDGSGLKITTSEYRTPKDNKIQKVGIEPDYVVELPEDVTNKLVIPDGKDTQLQKAVELLK